MYQRAFARLSLVLVLCVVAIQVSEAKISVSEFRESIAKGGLEGVASTFAHPNETVDFSGVAANVVQSGHILVIELYREELKGFDIARFDFQYGCSKETTRNSAGDWNTMTVDLDSTDDCIGQRFTYDIDVPRESSEFDPNNPKEKAKAIKEIIAGYPEIVCSGNCATGTCTETALYSNMDDSVELELVSTTGGKQKYKLTKAGSGKVGSWRGKLQCLCK